MQDGPLCAYLEMKRNGELQADQMQEHTIEKFQSLHNDLKDYDPTTGMTGWKARLGLIRQVADPPMGLYIYGGVGRGKSMLMAVSYTHLTLPTNREV